MFYLKDEVIDSFWACEKEWKSSQTALIDIVETSSYQEYIFLLP